MKTMLKYLSLIFLALLTSLHAGALPAERYAASSVLGEGKWVKISVEQTGMHLISTATLRQWGFSDPSRVRVYGYGGRRIPDLFTSSGYIDDLPMVQSETISKGVVFYAVGTDTRVDADNGVTGNFYRAYNPYSTVGYYFLTDTEAPAPVIPVEGSAPAGGVITQFIDGLQHEVDEVSPIESGHVLVGEDFRLTPSRTFSFDMPGRVEGTDVWMQCDFYANSSGETTLSFTANGQQLTPLPADRIAASGEFGDSCRIRKRFVPQGSTLNIGITARSAGTVKLSGLDHLAVCYTRSLSLPASGMLEFTVPGGSPELAGASASTRVWDVTDHTSVIAMPLTPTTRGVAWKNDYYGTRSYVAWNENASFLTPRLASAKVANQNLHALEAPDMVIITHPELVSQANRIAAMHRAAPDNMDVLVITPEEIYNEFASGVPDVNAFRRFMKMFRDRAVAGVAPRSPGYLLLFGGVTYDHRRLTAAWRASKAFTLPTWQTDQARSDSYSFCSDDPITFLEDNAGAMAGRDVMGVAVGRIPARTLQQATRFTDRLIAYRSNPAAGEWRNRVVILADDGDDGIHQTQSETMESMMRSTEGGENLTYRKVYLNAYHKVGGVVEAARTKLHSLLSEGVVLWNYVGHGSPTALTAEGVYTVKDVNESYYRNPPFFYGATCSFAKWDAASESALQVLTLGESSSLIGGISAVRPVLINRNGPLTALFGSELFVRESDGRRQAVGQALRSAKNQSLFEENKLRYVYLGDPALRLAIPDNIVTLDSIDGVALPPLDSDEEPGVVKALARTRLSGSVLDGMGGPMDDFDGYVSVTLYDAELSYNTVRNDLTETLVIDEQGERLFAGRARVKDGRWSIDVVIPSEIADNYRPATLSLYARSETDSLVEACGVSREFYVYGKADNMLVDTENPQIEYLYLNHETFRPGDKVNDTPMLLARVSDNVGLNMSTSGVGHQMSLRIDGTTNLTDLSGSFVPDDDGSPAGTIAYQLPALSTGAHTGVLKVWDVNGNSSSSEIEFFVDPTVAPKIFEVYSDANPATVEANFYVKHNRPDAMLTVTIDIYDLSGRRMWTKTVRGRADMFVSAPVNWNLTDSAGGKVSRGIYLYRTTVTTEATGDEAGQSSTLSRRIAVAPL